MFKCEVCEKEFAKEGFLKNHKRMAHPPGNAPELTIPEPAKESKKVQLFIHHVEGELDYAFVRITGKDTINKSFRIQRGQWVTVPEEVVQVLRDAVVETTKYEQDPATPGAFKKTPVSYTRYPMSEKPVEAA